jgi:hypothetical protein
MELYKSKSIFQNNTVELSFTGISCQDNKNINSNVSNVLITFIENSKPLNIIWKKVFHDCVTPIYPWLNNQLCVLTNRFVAIAIENKLQFLEPESGDTICTFKFGNTSIVKIEFFETENAIFILSQYQGFKFDQQKNKSNLYKMSFSNSIFSHVWTAELDLPEILIENFNIKESVLTVITKNEEIIINSITGTICF